MERDYHISIHGIKIKHIAQVCIVFCIVLLAFTNIGISEVNKSYQDLIVNTDHCVEGQRYAVMLERASDYLTDQVRMFVISQDVEHMNNYFSEVSRGTREEAVRQLQAIYGDLDTGSVQKLSEALQESVALEETEVHAMKLIVCMLGMEPEQMPSRVADWELTQEEQVMTPQELKQRAYELVYGYEYHRSKEAIEGNTQGTLDLLIEGMEKRQKESGRILEETLWKQRIVTFMMMALVCVVFSLIGVLIIYPVNEHVRSIQNNKRWKNIGGYEIRYLADIYNKLYDRNEMYKEELEYKAGHDALTGICNREAFEEKKDALRDRDIHLALLIVDVDDFKQVNDSMGHEIGDAALKFVADQLGDLVKENRYCLARIGGDEFALVLLHIAKDKYPRIEAEVKRINELIAFGNQENNIPPLSISVGVAFSQNGYSDKLFHQADLALYYTKKHGRHGCSMYEKEMGE